MLIRHLTFRRLLRPPPALIHNQCSSHTGVTGCRRPRNDGTPLIILGEGRKAGNKIVFQTLFLSGLSALSQSPLQPRHCEGGTTEAIP